MSSVIQTQKKQCMPFDMAHTQATQKRDSNQSRFYLLLFTLYQLHHPAHTAHTTHIWHRQFGAGWFWGVGDRALGRE